MGRCFWILSLLVAGLAIGIGQSPAAGDEPGPPRREGDAGPRRTADEDGGRPVDKIAKELGVTPEKFREVFRKVTPAPRGEQPSDEQRAANRKLLAEGLGVSPAKLDEVMDKYRPEGPNAGPRRGDGAGTGDRPQSRTGRGDRPAPPEGGPPPRGPRDGDQPGGGPPEGGRRGPPPHNSERFVEHAMQFDADGDGKLDRNELMKFAEDMGRRRAEMENASRDRGRPESDGPPAKDGERPPRSPRNE